MINNLIIENYKCFSNLRLTFGSLTLLTGFNGGGKSSAIQPLLLLSQNLKNTAYSDKLYLNGHFIKLGSVGDVLPQNSLSPSVLFKISSNDIEYTWLTTNRAGDRYLSLSQNSKTKDITQDVSSVVQALSELSYLSAVRSGADDAFPIPNYFNPEIPNVGVNGEYAPFWYERCVDDEIPKNRLHPNEKATSLRKQLDAWLASLFPGSQANVQHIAPASIECLQFRLSSVGEWRRPANVGYGFSYAFPILVMLLTAREGQIVVIDSPEAHLHPYAQSQMGRLLTHIAAAGVQIIIESHSDHLLNGVRLGVKEKSLAPDNLQIHFFSGSTESAHGVLSLNIDHEGRIKNWPEGFFDQSEKDLAKLSGWE